MGRLSRGAEAPPPLLSALLARPHHPPWASPPRSVMVSPNPWSQIRPFSLANRLRTFAQWCGGRQGGQGFEKLRNPEDSEGRPRGCGRVASEAE